MSQYQNEAKYKDIMHKKQAQPTVPLVKLCDDQKVSYQSYNNWFKKQSKEAKVPTSKLRITIHVSMRELTNLIAQGIQEIPISIESVLRGLPDHEQRALAEELGRLQLERLANKQSNNGPEQRLMAGPNSN